MEKKNKQFNFVMLLLEDKLNKQPDLSRVFVFFFCIYFNLKFYEFHENHKFHLLYCHLVFIFLFVVLFEKRIYKMRGWSEEGVCFLCIFCFSLWLFVFRGFVFVGWYLYPWISVGVVYFYLGLLFFCLFVLDELGGLF